MTTFTTREEEEHESRSKLADFLLSRDFNVMLHDDALEVNDGLSFAFNIRDSVSERDMLSIIRYIDHVRREARNEGAEEFKAQLRSQLGITS